MDPRFDDPWKQREASTELIAILDKVFATRTRDEWLQILKAGGLKMAFAPVNDMLEATSDPQALANEYVTTFDDPELGRVKLGGFPVHFSETSASVTSLSPEIGQHTEEVLLEMGGYSWEEIGELREQRVI